MTRLFVPAGALPPAGGPTTLAGAAHHYLVHVLRLRPGDVVTLVAPGVGSAEAVIRSMGEGHVALEAGPVTGPARRAGPRSTLLLGLLKGEKFDLVVQKATELGVDRVVPVACARSVTVLEGERAQRRQERWARIAQAAAQQCGRPDLPEIALPTPLPQALAALPTQAHDLRLVCWEGIGEHTLAHALPRPLPPSLLVLVGPEGGLEAPEVAAAQAAGFVPCGLGPRILRAETAALAILAVLAFVGGD